MTAVFKSGLQLHFSCVSELLTATNGAVSGFSITPFPATETVKRGVLGAFILKLSPLSGFAT